MVGCGGKSDFAPMARKKRQKPLPPLAGRVFTKVSDAEAEIRHILKTYEPVKTPVEGSDGELLTAWMRTHESMPYTEERHGPLMHIEIRFNPEVTCADPKDRRQVWCVFNDGYADPFSYKAARSNWGVTVDVRVANGKRHEHWIKRAARCLIESDIEEYKQVVIEGSGKCEVSGDQLVYGNADVHHDGLSFSWLLFNFITQCCDTHAVKMTDIEVVDVNTHGDKTFADNALAEAWIQYHAENATLLCVTKEAHHTLHKNMEKPNWEKLY